MATNLALDPKLIERAVKLSGEKTKKAAVTRALEEFIARRNQKRLVARIPPRPSLRCPRGTPIAPCARRR